MMGSFFRKLSRSDSRKEKKNASVQGGVKNEEEVLESVRIPQCSSSPCDDQEDETQQQQFDDAEYLQRRRQHRQDEERARREREHRNRLIEGQKNREETASSRNQFTKQQRVRYYHKISDQRIDEAVVVGVHYDDGPDKPYYTIKYNRPQDGSTMEKQTTEDRLEEVEFDEQKTWAILDATKKQ